MSLVSAKPQGFERVPAGYRHRTLSQLGAALKREGKAKSDVLLALLTCNRQACDPPLPEEEVVKLAASVVAKTDRQDAPKEDDHQGDPGDEQQPELPEPLRDRITDYLQRIFIPETSEKGKATLEDGHIRLTFSWENATFTNRRSYSLKLSVTWVHGLDKDAMETAMVTEGLRLEKHVKDTFAPHEDDLRFDARTLGVDVYWFQDLPEVEA